MSVAITPDALFTPEAMTRQDGSSRFRPTHHGLFTSQEIMDAEDQLLELARDETGPRLDPEDLDRQFGAASDQDDYKDGEGVAIGRGAGTEPKRPVVEHEEDWPNLTTRSGDDEPDRDQWDDYDDHSDDERITLGDDQKDALMNVATSGQVVDVLVGPAGAGKTTALAALRDAWELENGPGSVVGLAPSATAAAVLADDLGITTENTAKWLHDHHRDGITFAANQLVIVDEASLAGTLALHEIANLAAEAKAKVLLVGDYAQLQSVAAGGAFRLLVDDRRDAPELLDVHRFRDDWEKVASQELRHGRTAALDAYDQHERITGGAAEAMLEAAYKSWRLDLDTGRSALLIADNTATVRDLNARARKDRLATGHVEPGAEVALHDGLAASRGDVVITRQNDRRLIVGNTGWVRNGDRWKVIEVLNDGSVAVRRETMRTAGTITLPASYAAQHLELGYAVTAYRAQGQTVEAAHVIASESTTRENMYVAMTRGRSGNHAYVVTDPDDPNTQPLPGDGPRSARQILARVLERSGAEASAHEAKYREAETWGSIRQLGAEYDTLREAAIRDYWAGLLHQSLPEQQAETALESPALPPLIRAAEQTSRRLDIVVPEIANWFPISDDADPAAVLRQRLQQHLARSRNCFPPPGKEHILGMHEKPRPRIPLSPQMATALREREQAMEARAEELLHRAQTEKASWLDTLGPEPADRAKAARWRDAAKAIAAYRERHEITGPEPLGQASDRTAAQRRDAERIQTMQRAINPPSERRSPPFVLAPAPTRARDVPVLSR